MNRLSTSWSEDKGFGWCGFRERWIRYRLREIDLACDKWLAKREGISVEEFRRREKMTK